MLLLWIKIADARPKGTVLPEHKACLLRKSVVGNYLDQLCLPGMLWTLESVSELVERRFGIRLSRWTIGVTSVLGD